MTAKELLEPYRDTLARLAEENYGRITLMEALIRREAEHVAEVRGGYTPRGGWRNKLPLEHSTLMGWAIRRARLRSISARHGGEQASLDEVERILRQDADNGVDEADTMLNAENVYVDTTVYPAWQTATTRELIERAGVELWLA